MKFSHAIKKVEDRMTEIGIKDFEGQPVIGIECVPMIHSVLNENQKELWANLENNLEASLMMSPERWEDAAESYVEMMIRLIERAEVKIKHQAIRNYIQTNAWMNREES